MLLGAAYLPACGSSVCAAGSCFTSSPHAAASATANGWVTTLSLEPPAGPIDVRLRVPGPLQVESGCVTTLQAWAIGTQGTRIEASAAPGLRCHAIGIEDIPSGETRDFTATVPRTPPGRYTIHGLLRVHLPIGAGARVSENIPVVTLTVP